jgi:hypothetical protein
VVNFTPQPLHPQGKSPWYPLDRRPAIKHFSHSINRCFCCIYNLFQPQTSKFRSFISHVLYISRKLLLPYVPNFYKLNIFSLLSSKLEHTQHLTGTLRHTGFGILGQSITFSWNQRRHLLLFTAHLPIMFKYDKFYCANFHC